MVKMKGVYCPECGSHNDGVEISVNKQDGVGYYNRHYIEITCDNCNKRSEFYPL